MKIVVLSAIVSFVVAGCSDVKDGATAQVEQDRSAGQVQTAAVTAPTQDQLWCDNDSSITGFASVSMTTAVSYKAAEKGLPSIESSVASQIERNGGRGWWTKWENNKCAFHFRYAGTVDGNSYHMEGHCEPKIGLDDVGKKSIVELKNCETGAA